MSSNHKYSKTPLVSIGMPVFDRPETLRNALESLVKQTYKNLEIIVSDNASTNPLVAEIIEDYARVDSRIISFRQSFNHGAHANFLFVLEKAKGKYFMWASDDDQWKSDFVEISIQEIGLAALVMGDIETKYYVTGVSVVSHVPNLDPKFPVHVNVKRFLMNMQPSLIYGLHRTSVLRESIPTGYFDFWDCALVFKVMLRGGIKTISGIRYTAGVHDDKYKIKFVDSKAQKLLYGPFLRVMFSEILVCPFVSNMKKIEIFLDILLLVIKLHKHHKPFVLEQINNSDDK
jgi:glycosyltransferase involved in cell wall biosynthesis